MVAVTAVLAKILIDRKKKQITLEDPNTKYALKLVEKQNISHDTRKFVFALPSENHVLGLPVGEINLHLWILDKYNLLIAFQDNIFICQQKLMVHS